MFESGAFVIGVAGIWVAIGVVLSVVMGRRGHSGFEWLVLGTMLGPLGIVLAIDAGRHDELLRPVPVDAGALLTDGSGSIDVLVGYDGSPESAAALEAVVHLLGGRLGRLTVAGVVPYGSVRDDERRASSGLRGLAARTAAPAPRLEILHGHPSVALAQAAVDDGYDLLAVGTRGAGVTKSILGSAASELARHSKIPVLVVGTGS
jgi:nucleotide-binding universal stress UspA family protein